MKKAEIKIGSVYLAKVSNQLAPVQIKSISPYGGWDATNLSTGRDVRIRGAARLREELERNPETGKWRASKWQPVAMAASLECPYCVASGAKHLDNCRCGCHNADPTKWKNFLNSVW